MTVPLSVGSALRSAAAELVALADAVDENELAALRDAVLAARRVYFTGAGRSGLMARAVAMRMMHIGLASFAVGEIATPGIAAGDLLVCFSARGSGSITAQARTAREQDAGVAVVTTASGTPLTDLAGWTVVLPVRNGVATEQHAGSLFEQGCLVVGDVLCRAVQTALGVPTAELDRRHANLS
ncbi:SIS domain-containing protein [Nakamurella flavida]|uniref:SIS domain-containing protein n=1 Tax=Nakamurella flavida TaxID=363630 RepID=A0A939C1I0_9ACTN|nr:SIS domain-containing protein [Nakamurella flavida]MBM9475427.1 SIS domain-containing protein [Nakamurella flavida]MBM9475485.1 SIS domain-containing protein [Nakamurella flavida]MDP9777007.1 6-phospho-3-hexuloisomerase [Nakamurella flavida]